MCIYIYIYALLGTNISPPTGTLKMTFLFPFGGICDRSLEGTHLLYWKEGEPQAPAMFVRNGIFLEDQ